MTELIRISQTGNHTISSSTKTNTTTKQANTGQSAGGVPMVGEKKKQEGLLPTAKGSTGGPSTSTSTSTSTTKAQAQAQAARNVELGMGMGMRVKAAPKVPAAT